MPEQLRSQQADDGEISVAGLHLLITESLSTNIVKKWVSALKYINEEGKNLSK
jgi:hypothetical protein